jgi:ubiquinone/menaquinone biosynthesis C-methylase UbiE
MADNVFFEMFEGLPRQGPGSSKCTKSAFEYLANLPDEPKILDVGCGVGAQTMVLTEICRGTITAVDNHQRFLDTINEKAKINKLDNRIKTINDTMFDLKFEPESFDVIWSEGAIYIIGFEKGLTNWRKFLKPNGYIAVTHLSWLREDPPDELIEFWKKEFPAIASISENLQIIEKIGFDMIKHFVLPDSTWLDEFYDPLEVRIQQLIKKYKNNPKALEVLNDGKIEIELFRKYSDWYGYVFYIMQKRR